jgi:hypothetical protein
MPSTTLGSTTRAMKSCALHQPGPCNLQLALQIEHNLQRHHDPNARLCRACHGDQP